MRITRLLPTAAGAALVVALAVPAGAAVIPIYPGVTSDNVTFLGNFPDSLMISAEFALTGNFFYSSSLDTISAFSYTIDGDDIVVTHEGTMPDAKFENESMTYGERRDDSGAVTDRFVIVAEDLFHVDPAAATDTHVGGDNVIIVDVTDPTAPFMRSQGEVSTSTHTVQCLDRANCEYAYAVGGGGEFSIIDLRDLDNPVEVQATGASASEDGHARSPAAGPNPVFSTGAGHYWDIDDAGIAWQTGSGGAAAFDVSDPTNPIIIGATDETGTQSPFNDFVLHNSMRPNGVAFDGDRTDGNEPSIAKGNILLITEEDYANEGDEVMCDLAGEFSSWHIPSLGNASYLASAGDEPFTPNQGSITHLDSIHPVRDGFGSPTSTPADTFCSAHWFDYHETGIVAEGYYSAGLYFLDVRDPSDLGVYGYATARPSEVWDAYWFPVRDADGVDTGANTNFVMAADAVRGVDVFRVDLPEDTIAPLAAPTDDGGSDDDVDTVADTDDPDDDGGLAATGGGLAGVGLLGLGAAAMLRRRRSGDAPA